MKRDNDFHLRKDESIASSNATVIVNGEGHFSGWFDNEDKAANKLWYVWFKIGNETARLEKGYKLKPTAVKLGNKVFGKGGDFVVSLDKPFDN